MGRRSQFATLKSALLKRDLKLSPETSVEALKGVSFAIDGGEASASSDATVGQVDAAEDHHRDPQADQRHGGGQRACRRADRARPPVSSGDHAARTSSSTASCSV